MHYPAVVTFLIDVFSSKFGSVKPQLVEACRELETDDRGYLYPTEKALNAGGMVGGIANFKELDDLNIGKALRNIIMVMSYEDIDFPKYIFIVSDRYKASHEFQIKRSVELELMEDYNCNFIFINLGKEHEFLSEICKEHKNCEYFNKSVEQICEIIVNGFSKGRNV